MQEVEAKGKEMEALLFGARQAQGPKTLTREQILDLPDQEILQLEAKQLVDLGRDVLKRHLTIEGPILEKMGEYWKENRAGFRAMSDKELYGKLVPVVQKIASATKRR